MTATSPETFQLVRRLMEEIRREGLTVGDRLPPIRELAARLNVNSTKIRDGVVRAQTMGLLKIFPRSGVFVQALNFAPLVSALSDALEPALAQEDHNLFHLVDARGVLEVELVGQAAAKRTLEAMLPLRQAVDDMLKIRNHVQNIETDIQFHLTIARLVGNPVLVTMLQATLNLLRPCLIDVKLRQTSEGRRKSDESHESIYGAILEGDVERARAEMRDHVALARTCLLEKVRPTTGRNSQSRAFAAVEVGAECG